MSSPIAELERILQNDCFKVLPMTKPRLPICRKTRSTRSCDGNNVTKTVKAKPVTIAKASADSIEPWRSFVKHEIDHSRRSGGGCSDRRTLV